MSTNAARRAAAGVILESAGAPGLRVGTLARGAGGETAFTVDQAYMDLGPSRPIVSCRWIDVVDEARTLARLRDAGDKTMRGGRLPPWFEGLLPEGALRALVERQLGTGRHDDYDVICHLGADLPGAVVVHADGTSAPRLPPPAPPTVTNAPPTTPLANAPPVPVGAEPPAPAVRFSLAGVQLKFSMRAAGERLTVPGQDAPAEDTLGDVIVKLPTRRYTSLPELEYAAMRLAAAAGVETADAALRPVAAVDGLPADWLRSGGQVLVVRRFDRAPAGRIHIEDFAQIIGAVGDQKYTRANVETVLRMVSRFCADPAAAVLQAVRRVVVDILLGNNDAHLKNWSLIYRDPRRPALAPAYDIVPTWLYDRDPGMALRFGGTRSAHLIDLDKFRRTASWLDMDPRALERAAREAVDRAAATWPKLLPELPIAAAQIAALGERWATLAIAEGAVNGFAPVKPAKGQRRTRSARRKRPRKA